MITKTCKEGFEFSFVTVVNSQLVVLGIAKKGRRRNKRFFIVLKVMAYKLLEDLES